MVRNIAFLVSFYRSETKIFPPCSFELLENNSNTDTEWKYFGIINNMSITYCEIDFSNCIDQNIETKQLGLKLVVSINGVTCSAKHNYYGDDQTENKIKCIKK